MFLAILLTHEDDREAPALTGPPPCRYLFPDAGGLMMAPDTCSFLSPTRTGWDLEGLGWAGDVAGASPRIAT